MLNKPKYMSPSTNLNECVIDANAKEIPFSCIVDGNESISAWRIRICTLNKNSEVLNTGKQTLNSPFYPVDNKNRNVVFKRNLKDCVSADALTSFINTDSPYYWTIEFWGTKDKEKDTPTTTSCEEVFYANSTPAITLQHGKEVKADDGSISVEYTDCTDDEEDIILDSRKCYFKVTYSQEQSIPIKKYGWRITDINSGAVLVDTISSNQIYGVDDNISCIYEGFLSDVRYSVEVFIETQSGVSIITAPKIFKVAYEMTYLTNDFKIELLKKEPAVILDWSDSVVIGGHAEGDVSYISNYPIVNYSAETPNTSVVIKENSSVIYDYGSSSNLDIPETSYITISTQLTSTEDAVLFLADGTDYDGYEIVRKLSFSEGSFIYSVLGSEDIILTKTYTPVYQPNEYVWYVITMSPMLEDDGGNYYIEFKVNESVAENGLYPSDNLYPSDDLYPNFGTWELKTEGGA